MAPYAFKSMFVASDTDGIIHTSEGSGVPSDFLRESLLADSINPDRPKRSGVDYGASESKAWRDVWSAGQDVGSIQDIQTTAPLVDAPATDYRWAGM
jgi:nitronate monooxygenase